MAKQQKTTLWARATNTAGKRFAIAAVIVIGLPLIAYSVAQFGYQQRINALSSAIDSVWEKSLRAQNGERLKSTTTCPNVFQTWSIGINDVGPCPDYYTRFTVLVEPGKESAFMTSILSDNGYSTNIPAQSEYKSDLPFVGGGIKGDIGLELRLSPETDQPTSSGKQQYSLGITATEAKR